jgi:hypothetical protein
MQAQLAAGHVVEAAAIMPELDRVRLRMRSLANAFHEGYIEGAESAVHGLELTRDAAFALAGSIAAVVAAPLVAGYVAGAGFTGATATVLTIGGTGATVGMGMGVVRGASQAGGVPIAGGSLSEAAAGFGREFRRGLREGFVAGAAGGAGRLLGLAAGTSANVGQQVLIRVGGDFVVNSTSTMLDVLLQTCSEGHCDIGRAVHLGLANGVASIPGSIVGLSNSSVTRYFLGPLTAGATSYVSAIHAGATPEEAMRGAGIAVASNLAMARAQHGAQADQALEARGRAAGAATRRAVISARRRAASAGAAVLIGVSEGVPPARSGFGGTPIATIDSRLGAIGHAAPAAAAPASSHEAPAALDAVAAPTAQAAVHAEAGPAAPAASRAAAESTAPTTAQAQGALDDLNFEQALSPDAAYQVGERRTTGRSAASGRSRDFASLDRVVLSAAQRSAAIRLHGQRFSAAVRQAWLDTRNARELTDLQAIRSHWNAGRHDEARVLARATFNRHRNRFWRAVQRDTSLRALFTAAGMVFPAGGRRPPVYIDPTTGDQLDFMSIEHQTRLTDDPTLALDPANLQMALGDENSVTLEWIRRHSQP